jgi:hypothetical protein
VDLDRNQTNSAREAKATRAFSFLTPH